MKKERPIIDRIVAESKMKVTIRAKKINNDGTVDDLGIISRINGGVKENG